MKTFSKFLIHLCIAMGLSIGAVASVHETNNTPGYIKKVTMYIVVDNYEWGVTTFSCEHYLTYGQSLDFDDYGPVRYMLTGIQWIPTWSGPLPSAAVTRPKGGLAGLSYGFNSETTMQHQKERVSAGVGWKITGDPVAEYYWKRGCVGIAWIAMLRKIYEGSQTAIPPLSDQQFPEQTTTYADNER